MMFSTRIFKFFHPSLVYGIFFAIFDILFNCPFKFCKFIFIKQLSSFFKCYIAIVFSNSCKPFINFSLYFLLRFIKGFCYLLILIFSVIKCCLLQYLTSLLPILVVYLLVHYLPQMDYILFLFPIVLFLFQHL